MIAFIILYIIKGRDSSRPSVVQASSVLFS